jgi:arabinofuranosyltransferase
MTAPRLINLAVAACAIAGAAYYVGAEYRLAGGPGFPLDDPWIHAQFARNLARGLGFSFNPGEPTAGSTAPLYTLLLAVPAALGLDPLWSAKAIGAACTAMLAIAAAALARRVSGGSTLAAIVAGFGVALSSRLTWASVSGMEVPLYALLVVLALLAYLRWLETDRRPWLWGLLAALAGATRPETFVLFPLLSLHCLFVRRDRPLDRTARQVGQALAAFAVIVVAYVLLNMHGSGTPLPTTFYAKTGSHGVLNALRAGNLPELWHSLTAGAFRALNLSFVWYFAHSPPLFLALIAGVAAIGGLLPGIRAPRGAAALILVLVAAPLAMGAIAPHPPLLIQIGRYVGHLTALFFVIAGAGAAALDRLAPRRWIVPAFVATSMAWLAVQDVQFARHHAAMVRNMTDLDVAMGRWIAEHTASDAIVATNDIGALGYFSERYIVDMEGLVTPEILPYRREGRFVEYLERVKPSVLVIFPDWYPAVAARTDLFTEVYRRTAPKVIAGGESFVVYRTPWTGDRLILERPQ